LRRALQVAILSVLDKREGEIRVYEQIYEPVAGNLLFSTLVAAIPIIVLFVLLAGLRVAASGLRLSR
jgi:hypothetical protein